MEDEMRELRVQLKTARNDVKRYANYALRVQQELAREQQRAEERGADTVRESDARERDLTEDGFFSYADDDGDDADYSSRPPCRSSGWDEKVESSAEIHDLWAKKIDRILRTLGASQSAKAGLEATKRKPQYDNQTSESVETDLCDIQTFMQQQKLFIIDLGRENVKLRDMLRARPTRREFLGSHLEIERLKKQVQTLRARAKTISTQEHGDEVGDASAQTAEVRESRGRTSHVVLQDSSLSDRITEDKLLRWLQVETETPRDHRQTLLSEERESSPLISATPGRPYLTENVHCRLSLDPAALASILTAKMRSSQASRPSRTSTQDEISQRVGHMCSEIVASCCYVLDVKEVGKLPRYVEKVHRLARLTTVHQSFMERLEKLLKQFKQSPLSVSKAQSNSSPSCREVLDKMLEQVTDLLVELDARREQMKPPGSKAHEVLLTSMRLLRVTRIDQLAPTLRRLLDSMRAEQTFQRDLRDLLGLDEAATRKQILSVATMLFGELGFPTPRSQTRSNSAAPTRQFREVAPTSK